MRIRRAFALVTGTSGLAHSPKVAGSDPAAATTAALASELLARAFDRVMRFLYRVFFRLEHHLHRPVAKLR